MIKANFHTHTERCNHAGCSDRRYVDVAIEAGIEVLGFSDHTPYVGFENDFYSFYRMTPDRLRDYVDSVNALREEYKGRIEICLGLEAEYYPKLFPGLLEFLKPYGIEYLILGQHYLDDDQYGLSAHWIQEEKDLVKYTDQCIEGLETGLFSYLAHPDLPRFDRSHPAFRREMKRLCECSNRLSLPVEINVLGIYRGRHYPCEEFLEVCRECDSTVIVGVDAHLPDQFTDRESIEKTFRLIDKYGLRTTETIDTKRLLRYYEANT
ncbi:MAG: PHP domain-containing protein [Ruminococcaceae bacterium]|nr:PHP domain-containing protein [Oscillospiraceae bacterium]